MSVRNREGALPAAAQLLGVGTNDSVACSITTILANGYVPLADWRPQGR